MTKVSPWAISCVPLESLNQFTVELSSDWITVNVNELDSQLYSLFVVGASTKSKSTDWVIVSLPMELYTIKVIS